MQAFQTDKETKRCHERFVCKNPKNRTRTSNLETKVSWNIRFSIFFDIIELHSNILFRSTVESILHFNK